MANSGTSRDHEVTTTRQDLCPHQAMGWSWPQSSRHNTEMAQAGPEGPSKSVHPPLAVPLPLNDGSPQGPLHGSTGSQLQERWAAWSFSFLQGRPPLLRQRPSFPGTANIQRWQGEDAEAWRFRPDGHSLFSHSCWAWGASIWVLMPLPLCSALAPPFTGIGP